MALHSDTDDQQPATIIKKYANRRLYNTGTSTYVTLDDLADMVKGGEDFIVQDAKTSEDLTRSVLTQIIFEQESRGTNLLPITVLRQLIRFYDDSMNAVVPSYLEHSMNAFVADKDSIREKMSQGLGTPFGAMSGAMQEQTRRNMELFQSAMSNAMAVFSPFPTPAAAATSAEPAEAAPSNADSIDELRAQLSAMQSKLEAISRDDDR
ncbi:MAG: polyhydroxyalkanoate synthesis repressor PhaR [Devosiaceae bacterium]|nr:polyhydroxyalkanoate synthesis repressor PhaR [Devosiaceae bacterium MH13]